MQRPAVIDFTGIIHQHLDWYNASFSVDPGVYNKSRKSLQQDRAGKLSLHQFQTFYQDAACSVSFQNLDTPGTTKISPSDHIHLRFSIRGGTELPHFYMELQLRHPTDCNKSIQLSMIWTAWDLKAFGSDRKVTWKPTGNERFTFSSRLSGVSFRSSTHTSESAKDVGGTEGRPYYKIEWTHVTTPHCYGFGVPYTVSWLNQEQQRALRSFRAMNKTETTIRVSTRTESQMYPNWALMTAMPTPTPPPFPLYDCRYEVHQGEFGVIRNIPSTSNTTIQEHHRRRKIGWPNNLPGFQDPPQIFCFETSAPLTYVNERHYEATKTIGLLREADIQQANYIKQFNRQYDFDLWPASVVHNFQHHTMDEYFYAALRVDLRVAEDVQTMALPEPGTAVSVTTSKHAGFTLAKGAESQSASRNRWSGVVVGSVEFPQQADLPPTMVRVRLRRPQRLQSVGSVLHLAGWVTFGNPNVAINQLKRAIRYAMYGNKDFGIMPNNPIKKLLLGHENSSLRFYTTSNNVISCAEAYIGSNTTMHNPRQIEALRSIFTFGDWMKLVTLVTGPPGTGKTDISASVAECSYLNNMPILIVCGSNYGLNVVAERILERFKRANPKLNTDGLYRLDTDFGETIEMQMAPVAPDRNNKDFRSVREYLLASGVTPLLENAVRQSLSALIDVGPGRSLGLSLGRHIIQRIDLALELRSNWPQSNNQEREEYLLIWDFVTWQQCLLREGRAFAEPVDLEEADGPGAAAGGLFDAQDMHDIFVINHKRAWLCLQEYYISRAKIVLCTASTASRKCLRQFKPTIIIVEEASQLTETSALNAIVRYLPSLKKVVLSGDTAQLPPTVLSMDKNECFYSEKMSLFERLKLTGLPHIELNIQYRMNPQIATFVSNEFYNGRLQSHRSCNGRDTANDFSDAMVERYNCSNGTIFFVSVNNSSVWRRKGSWSLVNLEYVNFIGQLVLYFLGKGCPERSILILSFYDEERGRLSELIHKRLNRKNVRISNVDASQGDAEDIVILSTTRPGRRYGLGFVQNRQRQCVALSRAKDGLVVVGHEQMHTSSTPGGKGFLTWKQLTDYCRNSGRLITVNGSTNLVRTHLDLPNADYEDIAH